MFNLYPYLWKLLPTYHTRDDYLSVRSVEASSTSGIAPTPAKWPEPRSENSRPFSRHIGQPLPNRPGGPFHDRSEVRSSRMGLPDYGSRQVFQNIFRFCLFCRCPDPKSIPERPPVISCYHFDEWRIALTRQWGLTQRLSVDEGI